MKKYNKLLSFGCSYTEGGGLNSQNYHRYLAGEDYVCQEPETIIKEHSDYATYHSYPGYLSRLLNCEFINYGFSSASNEYIFKKASSVIKKEYEENVLVTVQSTHLNRILLYFVDLKQEININTLDVLKTTDLNLNNIANDFYKLYINYFFDEMHEFKKILDYFELLEFLCRSKNIDVVFITYDRPVGEINISKSLNKCILNTEGFKDIIDLTGKKKFKINDLPKCKYDDPHLTPVGNEYIANLIYRHLDKYD